MRSFQDLSFQDLFSMGKLLLTMGQYQQVLIYCNSWEKSEKSYKLYLIRAKAYHHMGDAKNAKLAAGEALRISEMISDKDYLLAKQYTQEIIGNSQKGLDKKEDKLSSVKSKKNKNKKKKSSTDTVIKLLKGVIEELDKKNHKQVIQSLEEAKVILTRIPPGHIADNNEFKQVLTNAGETLIKNIKDLSWRVLKGQVEYPIEESHMLISLSKNLLDFCETWKEAHGTIAYKSIGEGHYYLGHANESVTAFNKALARDDCQDSHLDCLLNRGKVYIRLKEYQKAATDLRRVLGLVEEGYSIHEHASKLLESIQPHLQEVPKEKKNREGVDSKISNSKPKKDEKFKASPVSKNNPQKRKKKKELEPTQVKDTQEIDKKITNAKTASRSLDDKIVKVTELEQKFKKAMKSLDPNLVDPTKNEIFELVESANVDFKFIQENIGTLQTEEAKAILTQSRSAIIKLEELRKNTTASYDFFTAKVKSLNTAKEKLKVAQNFHKKYKEKRKELVNLSKNVLENKDLLENPLEKAEELEKECKKIVDNIQSSLKKTNSILDEKISKKSYALKSIRKELDAIKIKPNDSTYLQKKVNEIKEHLQKDHAEKLRQQINKSVEDIKKAVDQLKNIDKEFKLVFQDKIAKLDINQANEDAKKLKEAIKAVEENIEQFKAIEKDLNSYIKTPVNEDFSSQINFLSQTKQSIQDDMKKLKNKQKHINDFSIVWDDIQEQMKEYEKKRNELIHLSKAVQDDKDGPSEKNMLENAKKLKEECELIANNVQNHLPKAKNILNNLNENSNNTIQQKLKIVEDEIQHKELQKLQEEVNIIDKHLAERQEAKKNLDNFLSGTDITLTHINFLFELSEEFPQLMMFGSGVIDKEEKRVVSVGDMDIRILEDEKFFEQKKLQLTTKSTLVEDTDAPVNVFFKQYKKKIPGSKLEIHLIYGRANGIYQYVGDELILPGITGQLLFSKTPLNDHLNYPVGPNRYFAIKKSQVFLDWQYARKHPEEFWAFGYEKIASQKQKGYLSIVVKQIEKMRVSGLLDEKELKKVTSKKSESKPEDPNYNLYSWSAVVHQWTSSQGIFATKMASTEMRIRKDCYLEIHALIKERGIGNKDAEPFVNAFFDALINNHPDRKNVQTDTTTLRNQILHTLKELYKKQGYPKNPSAVIQQFDMIVTSTIKNQKQQQSMIMTTAMVPTIVGTKVEEMRTTVGDAYERYGLSDDHLFYLVVVGKVYDIITNPVTQQSVQRILTEKDFYQLPLDELARKYINVLVETPVYGDIPVTRTTPTISTAYMTRQSYSNSGYMPTSPMAVPLPLQAYYSPTHSIFPSSRSAHPGTPTTLPLFPPSHQLQLPRQGFTRSAGSAQTLSSVSPTPKPN